MNCIEGKRVESHKWVEDHKGMEKRKGGVESINHFREVRKLRPQPKALGLSSECVV